MSRLMLLLFVSAVLVSCVLAAPDVIHLGPTGLGLFDRFNAAAHIIVHGETSEQAAGGHGHPQTVPEGPRDDVTINYG
ncbi:hypothetical protein Zmor_021041 [Zophobas morio]|uniref:Secreted protein n=1 Tax=Zophobas morio TaxID=2755281 RepID=A0AA38I8J9_9CUCU|nr:hypothetical protein Zmor_021041 [Zophobas morio]